MTKDEPGPYNETSHIGWSGKVLRVNNHVFFIAKNNYLQVTSSTVPETYWLSCASLYHNVTASDITIRVGDTAVITDVAGYGYIIIDASGYVRVSSLDRNPEAMITLKPNEMMLAVRYLDSLLSNPIFVPVDKISVGTYIEFTDYDALTNPAVQAQKVIDLIDALPSASEITLETDLLQFMIARDAYEALSDEAKALVTNLDKLESAEEKISELKEQVLNDAKQDALELLDQFQNNLHLYSEANQQTVINIINNTKPALQNAATITQVEAIIDNALTLLDNVLTIEGNCAFKSTKSVGQTKTCRNTLTLIFTANKP